MGLFSFFKKEENYEEILAGLEQDIKQAEKQRIRALERREWWAHTWLFYSIVGWLAYLAGFVLYVWPERHGSQASGFLLHATLVSLAVPLVVYYGNVATRAIWQRAVNRHDARIKVLKEELKERLDELKKKTAYDTTKNLIDKYEPPKALSAEKGPAAQNGPLAARLQKEVKNRRRTMPNFGTSGAQPGEVLAAGAARQGPRQQLPPGQKQPALPATAGTAPAMQQRDPSETGVVRLTPAVPPTQAVAGGGSWPRPWLDKLVDQLVGDVGSEHDKYALVCRHCYAHNGLVLEEEIRDIQYTCPKCGRFNPSLRALREGTVQPLQPEVPAGDGEPPAAEERQEEDDAGQVTDGSVVEGERPDDQSDSEEDAHSDSDGGGSADEGATPLAALTRQQRLVQKKASAASLKEAEAPSPEKSPGKTHARSASKSKPENKPRRRKVKGKH